MTTGLSASENLSNVLTGVNKVKSNLVLATTLDTDFKELSDNEKSYNQTFLIASVFGLGHYKLSLPLSVTKELTGQREQSLNDSKPSLSFSLGKIKDWAQFSGLLKTIIPLSESSKKITGLQTGVQISPSVTIDLSKVGLKNFSLNYYGSVLKNFHKYETATNGESNFEYALSHGLEISKSFGEVFSISIDGSYERAVTYQKNTSDQYSIGQGLSYLVAPRMALSFGHSLRANVLAPNKRDTRIELFNNRKSNMYLDFRYTF